MKKIILIQTLFIFVFILSCSEDSPLVPDDSLIVVQAYLYANEPVTDIRITHTLSLDADSSNAPPINNADVYLTKQGISYVLDPSPGDSGYYHNDSIQVSTGDEFSINIEYEDQSISGETIVPDAPVDVTISQQNMIIPADFDMHDLRSGVYDSIEIEVNWTNNDESLYYIVLDNIEDNPAQLDIGFSNFPRRFISQPVNRDNYPVRIMMITHYGRHRVKVYKINQEYADLYESRQQDSRDLNEPLTNIKNGLGIFTAFNCDSVFFDVIPE